MIIKMHIVPAPVHVPYRLVSHVENRCAAPATIETDPLPSRGSRAEKPQKRRTPAQVRGPLGDDNFANEVAKRIPN